MHREEDKKKFIEIIEELTAIIENGPNQTIKEAMIQGIKAKTKELKENREPQPELSNKEIIPEAIIFGLYIKQLDPPVGLQRKTIAQHYEDFLQS